MNRDSKTQQLLIKKVKEILDIFMNELNTRCGVYMTDDPLTTTAGKFNLYPTEEKTGFCIQTNITLIHVAAHFH